MDMEFYEFLRFSGYWLYMDFFEGVVDRPMWWSNTDVTFLRNNQVGSLNTFPSTGLNKSYSTCHTLIRISPRTMQNYSTCVIWKMHGMKTWKRVLNLPGLSWYMGACNNVLVSIIFLIGCVLDVSLTPLGMRDIPLLVGCRQPCGLQR